MPGKESKGKLAAARLTSIVLVEAVIVVAVDSSKNA